MLIHDLNPIDKSVIDPEILDKVELVSSWEECYLNSDVFVTCTVSAAPYIDKAPKKGSLQLNVSLRDYTVEMKDHMDTIIVDNWEEVCRQNTDIENMHLQKGLNESDTLTIDQVLTGQGLGDRKSTDVVMFNPMGMAIFDIAVGGYYYAEALNRKIGHLLPD